MFKKFRFCKKEIYQTTLKQKKKPRNVPGLFNLNRKVFRLFFV